MLKDIYKEIKKYNNIVIARHIGVDPDALASQISLRDSIKKTFPDKHVLAVGGSSAKFNYFPKLDKTEELDNALLIVVDTPELIFKVLKDLTAILKSTIIPLLKSMLI